jgi:proteasome accessory factor B
MRKGKRQSLSHRPPLDRMLRIHQAVQAGRFPNASVLAAELEVCAKSVHRDPEFMRDRLLLPLEFDRLRKGWHYTEEVTAFPTLQITEGEIVALLVAEKALQQYRGTSFEKPLLSALRKMEESLPQTISVSLNDIDQSISFQSRIEPILNLDVFDAVARATAGRRQIEIEYRKPGETAAARRVIDPYHLANINGEWYLFAHDHLRNDLRTFAPARIKSLRETGITFQRREDFSLQQRLRDSFGVHSGKGTFQVVLRFSRRAADYIREKKWHDSQELRELKDGAVELRMRLSSLAEVERWVLSWGGEAKVMKPRELEEAVKNAARKLLRA